MNPAQFALILSLVLRAFANWGAPAMPVQLHDGTGVPADGGVASASLPGRDVDGLPLCQVWLYPGFWEAAPLLGPAWERGVIDHEVGHCLGFIHPDPPLPDSAMSLPAIGVTPWDRARYYNREHPQLRFAMVAH